MTTNSEPYIRVSKAATTLVECEDALIQIIAERRARTDRNDHNIAMIRLRNQMANVATATGELYEAREAIPNGSN